MMFNNINVRIGQNVKLGNNVKIGDNTVIYDNVEIGDNTIICNDCLIGEPTNTYYHEDNYSNPSLRIGANSLIRSNSTLYAGSTFGNSLQTGNRATIRENTIAGSHCSFGTYVDIQGYCTFGDYVRLHSYVAIGQGSKIGSYVFISPFTVLTNDPTPPSDTIAGVIIGDYSQITSSCVLLPGCEIGEHCLVAANSTVNGVFENDCFIGGSPAKTICKLSRAPIFNWDDKNRHYPWPKHFSRNMPWDGIGWDNWLKENE